MNENKSGEKRKTPVCIYGMTKEQIDEELQKGVDSLKSGKVYTAEEVEAMFDQNYGVFFDQNRSKSD